MGERILRDEGYEVVSVTDGDTATVRLADVDPDVIVADVFLPGKSGLDLCRYIKAHPKHKHARLILTAGLLETFDEAAASAAGADAIIKKPFEASVLLDTVKPLMEQAQKGRETVAVDETPAPAAERAPAPPPPAAAPVTLAKPVAAAPEPLAAAPPAMPAPATPPATEIPILTESAPAFALTEEERVRAAVVVALDAAFPDLVDEITARVLEARRS